MKHHVTMKKWILSLGLLICGLPILAHPSRPAPTPNDTLKSVEALASGQVIFRIYAPKASQVIVSGDFSKEFGPKNLSKNEL